MGLAVSACIGLLVTPLAADAAESATKAKTSSRIPPAAAPSAATTPELEQLLQWIRTSKDNARQPFAVIDKRSAVLHVYDGTGQQRGMSAILLGAARGDDSVPGIGERKMSEIKPEERTTPAGRFATEAGRNLQNEDIVWIDYDAAVSMHRVRTANKADKRLERLATPTVEDNRISYGCVNVPASFYDAYVKPAFSRGPGVVYILPETRSLEAQFGALQAKQQASNR